MPTELEKAKPASIQQDSKRQGRRPTNDPRNHGRYEAEVFDKAFLEEFNQLLEVIGAGPNSTHDFVVHVDADRFADWLPNILYLVLREDFPTATFPKDGDDPCAMDFHMSTGGSHRRTKYNPYQSLFFMPIREAERWRLGHPKWRVVQRENAHKDSAILVPVVRRMKRLDSFRSSYTSTVWLKRHDMYTWVRISSWALTRERALEAELSEGDSQVSPVWAYSFSTRVHYKNRLVLMFDIVPTSPGRSEVKARCIFRVLDSTFRKVLERIGTRHPESALADVSPAFNGRSKGGQASPYTKSKRRQIARGWMHLRNTGGTSLADYAGAYDIAPQTVLKYARQLEAGELND